mmetsp:Transcript_25786/g.65806  ORF Transcript_25786/g.65806 Transcript_25786/m.65806 type:complete len:103 (-) Transcript_25786:153-461(-)
MSWRRGAHCPHYGLHAACPCPTSLWQAHSGDGTAESRSPEPRTCRFAFVGRAALSSCVRLPPTPPCVCGQLCARWKPPHICIAETSSDLPLLEMVVGGPFAV